MLQGRGPGFPFDGGVTADSLHVFPDYQAPTTLSYRDAAHAHDLGVVILDEPVWLDRYGELPTLGLLEDLAAVKGKTKANLTVVGYGLQQVKPVEIDGGDQRIRTVGSVSLVNLASTLSDGFNVQVTGNPGRANGGAGICFGDSGGPLLVGDTDIVLGVHALVFNQQCMGGVRVARPWLALYRSGRTQTVRPAESPTTMLGD